MGRSIYVAGVAGKANLGYNRHMLHSSLIKALLFDLDGTLVNTIGDIAFAMNKALDSIGIAPINNEDCQRFVGRGLRNALKRALLHASHPADEQTLDIILPIMLETYRKHPSGRSFIYPGMESFLQNSVAVGMHVGVLSNKEDSLVRILVDELFPDRPFVSVQGERVDVPLKPNPTSAMSFATMLGLAPSEILFVGDSEVDAETAKAAGMQLALVTWGFRPRSELESSGYGPLFDTVDELEKEVFV